MTVIILTSPEAVKTILDAQGAVTGNRPYSHMVQRATDGLFMVFENMRKSFDFICFAYLRLFDRFLENCRYPDMETQPQGHPYVHDSCSIGGIPSEATSRICSFLARYPHKA